MRVIEFFTTVNKEHWLEEIKKCDWGAGQYLYQLLSENQLKQKVGESALVPMLVDEDRLAAFCTFAPLDDIQPTDLSPWIGFLYTFPDYRGHRYAGMLLDYAESMAAVMGHEYLYISTNHVGLYEKYGYDFYKMEKDIWGESSRVYRKNLEGKNGMREQTMQFTIVRADAEDAAALLEYLKIVGGETDNLSFGAEGLPMSVDEEKAYLEHQAGSSDDIQYLAKVSHEIVGTASLNRQPRRMSHRGELGISLKKAYWGCGIASALMKEILNFAKANGFEQLNLEVRSDNARAIRLYEKYGFQKLCTFPGFFKIEGVPVDFDLMNLDLNP